MNQNIVLKDQLDKDLKDFIRCGTTGFHNLVYFLFNILKVSFITSLNRLHMLH